MADKKQGAAEGEPGAKKSGKGKIIVALVGVVLAAGAYVVGTKSSAPATGGEPTTTTIALVDGCVKRPDPGVPKTVVDLPEMSINLADGHYLRAAISLGLCADVVLTKPEEFLSAPARDIAVADLSGQKMSDLSTPAGRDAAKQRLTTEISAAYPGVVYEIFLVEFVMQ